MWKPIAANPVSSESERVTLKCHLHKDKLCHAAGVHLQHKSPLSAAALLRYRQVGAVGTTFLLLVLWLKILRQGSSPLLHILRKFTFPPFTFGENHNSHRLAIASFKQRIISHNTPFRKRSSSG
jgi:hypothetical protein